MAMGRFRRVTSDVLAQPLRGVKELLMASLIPAAGIGDGIRLKYEPTPERGGKGLPAV